MPVVRFNGRKLDPATIKALVSGTLVNGSKPTVWWNRQSIEFRNNFMDTMRTSARNGESLTQAITRVVGGTVDGVTVPGIMKTTKAKAGALAATAQNAVSNEAALKSFQANNDVIKAVTQLSTLDNRTSDICVAYSGQTWDVNTLQPIVGSSLPFNGGPPRHFNCRSRLRPVTMSFKELGVDVDEIPAGTRASMDGQVPSDITFNQFLKKKPNSFADDLLGPKRAQLWRDGDITLTQLVDMRGNPLSLQQLESIVGIKPKPTFNPATNKTINVPKPKPKKTVDGWLKNSDDTFVQITEAEHAEITAHAKRLVSAADDADELVTAQVKQLAKDTKAAFPDAAVIEDGPLVDEGSLFWRKKDLKSTSRKIQTYARDRNLTYTEAAEQISDSLRYTYVVTEENYIAAVKETMEKLAELGYKNGKFDPAWLTRPDYKGLNINMITPDGVKMELQFHTAKSFRIKNINHKLYEDFRTLSKAKQVAPEGQALQAEMLANAQTIPVPKNIKFLDELAKTYNKPSPKKQADIFAKAEARKAATKPKKTVNSFLENDDGSFVQITQAEHDEITGYAKKLVSAADEADAIVTQQIKGMADDVGAAFPDAAIVKDGPLVDEGSLFWRKKDLESTSRKIQTYARDRGITFAEAQEAISDSLRYTYVVSEENYIAAVKETMEKFAELGYKNGKFDAAWFKRPDYRGLNINMITPEGVKMELQFHTAQSFEIKNGVNHKLYEKFRKLSTAEQEGKQGQLLQAEMKAHADTIPFPPNIEFLDDLAKIYNKPKPAAQAKILDDAAKEVASRATFAETQVFNGEVAAALKDGDYLLARKTILDAADTIPDKVKKSALERIEQTRKASAKEADKLIAEKKFADMASKEEFNANWLDMLDEMDNAKIDKAVRLEVTEKMKALKTASKEKFATEDLMFHQVMSNFDEAKKVAATIENPSPAFQKLVKELETDHVKSVDKKVRLALENGNSDDALKELLKFGDTADEPILKALQKEIHTGTKMAHDKVAAIEDFIAKDMDDFAAFVKKEINGDDVPKWVWNKILKDPDFAIAEENAKWTVQFKNIEKQLFEGKVDDALAAVNGLPDTIYDKQKLKFAIETAKKKKDDIIKVEFPKKVKDIAVNELGFKLADVELLETPVNALAVMMDGVITEQFKIGLRKQLGIGRAKMREAIEEINKINKASKGVDEITNFASTLETKFSSHPEFQAAVKKVTAQAQKKASLARKDVIDEMIKTGKLDADDIITYGGNILKDAMKDVNKKLGVAQKKAKITEVRAKIASAKKNGDVSVAEFVSDGTDYDKTVLKLLEGEGAQQKKLNEAIQLFKKDGNDGTARSKLFDMLLHRTPKEQRAIKEFVHKRVNPKTLPTGQNWDSAVADVVTRHANNANAADIQKYIKLLTDDLTPGMKTNFNQTVLTRSGVKSIDDLGVIPEGQASPAVERIRAELAKKDPGNVPIPTHTRAEELAGAKRWLGGADTENAAWLSRMKRSSDGQISISRRQLAAGEERYGKGAWGLSPEDWDDWIKNVAPTLDEWDVALMNQYTGGMAGQINAGLYNGGLDPLYTGGARALNSALDKMPKHTGKVYRGTRTRENWSADLVDARYQVGETVIERGFGSSATQESAAFSGNIKFVILTHGKNGAIMGHVGGFGAGEMEVLFKAGSRFRVLRKRRDGQDITVTMEEV